jgi:hypothetical protein
MKHVVVVVGLLGLGLVALAWGDDASDRKQYVEEIKRLLDGMRSDLGYVANDSGTSYVDAAIRKADDLKDRVGRLKGREGGDSDARKMVSDYASYVDRFKTAAGFLRQLKAGQRSLDALPRRCEDKTKEMLAKIRGYTSSHDPRGMDEVPKLAREGASARRRQGGARGGRAQAQRDVSMVRPGRRLLR